MKITRTLETSDQHRLPEIIDREGTIFVYGSLAQGDARIIKRIAEGLKAEGG